MFHNVPDSRGPADLQPPVQEQCLALEAIRPPSALRPILSFSLALISFYSLTTTLTTTISTCKNGYFRPLNFPRPKGPLHTYNSIIDNTAAPLLLHCCPSCRRSIPRFNLPTRLPTVTNNGTSGPEDSSSRAPCCDLLSSLLALRHAVLARKPRLWSTWAKGGASRPVEPQQGVQIALRRSRAVFLSLAVSFSGMGSVLPSSNPRGPSRSCSKRLISRPRPHQQAALDQPGQLRYHRPKVMSSS